MSPEHILLKKWGAMQPLTYLCVPDLEEEDNPDEIVAQHVEIADQLRKWGHTVIVPSARYLIWNQVSPLEEDEEIEDRHKLISFCTLLVQIKGIDLLGMTDQEIDHAKKVGTVVLPWG